jgi:hypothetical protein
MTTASGRAPFENLNERTSPPLTLKSCGDVIVPAVTTRRSDAIDLSPLLAVYLGAWFLHRAPGRPTGDEPDLLGYAGRLLDGHYATPSPATGYLWHGPGLPGALAPLLALHAPLWLDRLVLGPLVTFAVVVGLASVLRRTVPDCRPRAVAAAFGLYLPLLSIVSSLHKEPLSAGLVVVAMGAASRGMRDGSRLAIAVAGCALAGLAMTRVEYGWVLIALLCAAAVHAAVARTPTARRRLAIPAVALALCVPWLAYTDHVSGRLGYWGNAGGLSLYWMSSPDPAQLGEWHAVHTVRRRPGLRAYRSLFRRLQALPPAVEDARLRALAIRQSLGHPLKYALNVVANAGRMFAAWPFGVPVAWWGVAGVALSNAVLLAALLRRRRRSARGPELAAFGAFAAVALAVHLLPSSEPRMMIPVVPVLVWLAAARSAPLSAASSRRRAA